MKKWSILLFIVIALFGLTGCVQETLYQFNEGKEKVEYLPKITKIAFSTTDSTTQLINLYQDTPRYLSEEWKAEFYEHKAILEENLEKANSLTPPDFAYDYHYQFVSALQAEVEMNNEIDEVIQSGEGLWANVAKPFEETIGVYQDFGQFLTDKIKELNLTKE